MPNLTVKDPAISVDGRPWLTDIGGGISVSEDPRGVGLFLRFVADRPSARQVYRVGDLTDAGPLLCHARSKPYWMTPKVVARAGDVPLETQFVLAAQRDGRFALLVPLLDGGFRMSLQGTGEHGLELVAESGDPAVVTDTVLGLFIAVGDDPFTLIDKAAQSVCDRLQTGRLRRDKDLPAFIDQFGWCTWDAFYGEVSHDKVEEGLVSFAAGGIYPRLVILDVGWQSVERSPDNGERLTAFQANEKFPGGLAATTALAKDSFGVETFLVWHAMAGATGGVDGHRLPGYDVRDLPWRYSPAVVEMNPGIDDVLGEVAGVVPPDSIHRFYHDYHRALRMEGVDGVKADFQTTIEALGATLGGRVELARRYRQALEGSAHTHFKGNLINCMSCSNDHLYSTLNSNLTRTSEDFMPLLPDSHGEHLFTNAQVGLWFGEFVHPDWDMFETSHEHGAFHAAGRAVSGGPVYVSDPPDAHDFALLAKLVLPTGHVLRARLPGRPTRDCLFIDPLRDNALLKIFNHNACTGLVGVFNCRSDAQAPLSIATSLRPTDVVGLRGERFAIAAHMSGEVRVVARDEDWPISLAPMTFEIFTISPISNGVAPLGLVGMFNAGGSVIEAGVDGSGEYTMQVHNGGMTAVWCATKPARVLVDGRAVEADYQAATNVLYIGTDGPSATSHVQIQWRHEGNGGRFRDEDHPGRARCSKFTPGLGRDILTFQRRKGEAERTRRCTGVPRSSGPSLRWSRALPHHQLSGQ